MKKRLIKKLLKQKGSFMFIRKETGEVYLNFSYKKTKWYQFHLLVYQKQLQYEKILQQI